MPIPRPDPDALRRLAADSGLALADAELEQWCEITAGLLASFDMIEALEEPPRPPVPQREWRRPEGDENSMGAWVVKTSVRESSVGRLAGRSLVLKDNVALAGVPMSGGASFLEGFQPEEDASIVRRALDEGAEIVGKSACEYLSASGGSHTSCSGRIHNPHRPGHSAGGSSSGSGALVGAREVDMAIGGDQGGSIRIPASFCGIVGMKPTHGLVPYTGILSIDAHIDHTGPMTATVADNALLLEVIAGPDGIDPRQLGVQTEAYTEALGRGAQGLRIGILEEGFAECTPGVDTAVRGAGERLAAAGAKLQRVSVPMHATAGALIIPFLITGGMQAIRAGGFATHMGGTLPFGLPEAFAAVASRNGELPPNLKAMWLAAAQLEHHGGPALYAKAKRLCLAARTLYDQALLEVDALLMPTTSTVAPPLCPTDASLAEQMAATSIGVRNTAQFDATGHPAISVPCGTSEGLPVGAMLVGRHFAEATLYRLAEAIEASR
ncbi:MAG: amidase [Deltaproteobacteria bacterium]|nr:amidase [Deltaproteobacteria bacterium]MBW2362458.1 amidase [Deltaproteobacteria bacterium]